MVARSEGHPDTAYGRLISAALDANGDRCAVYEYQDPNGDGKFEDSQLLFEAWDRAA